MVIASIIIAPNYYLGLSNERIASAHMDIDCSLEELCYGIFMYAFFMIECSYGNNSYYWSTCSLSILLRALIGLVLGSFFRMPVLGFLLGAFWHNTPQTHQSFFTFQSADGARWHNFLRVDYTDDRWIEGCFKTIAAFATMKGQVSDKDIQFAQALMDRWNYSPLLRKKAIAAFRSGRTTAQESILDSLQASNYWRHTAASYQLFDTLKAYLSFAHAEEKLHLQFKHWADALLHQRTEYRSHHHKQSHYSHQRVHQASRDNDTSWACGILKVTMSDTQEQTKKAFRKLMAKNHPDRNHKDPLATEKTQDIQKAYAIIKEARGWA